MRLTRQGALNRSASAAAVSIVLSVGLACGSGSASPVAVSVTGGGASTVASPSPSPSATPTPAPQATPTPTPEESPEINDNDAPVDHVGAGVYYVDCNGELVPDSRNAKEVPVGCRVHLDATPKDADNVPTNPRVAPEWWFSNPGAIEVSGSNPLGPMITARVAHRQTINVWVDGVQSNTFSINFQ